MVNRDNETWIAELKGLKGRQRQEAAFQDLGNALLPLILWYLRNCAGLTDRSYRDLEQLARDIVQESLMSIWQRGLKLYERRARFLTYAKTIALNEARQKVRQILRWREDLWSSFDGDEQGEEDKSGERLSIAMCSKMVTEELLPEKRVMLQEALQCAVCILMERCSPREREALVAKYLDGLKAREIAQLMGTTDVAVNLLTFNARKKLKQGLEKEGYTLEELLDVLNLNG